MKKTLGTIFIFVGIFLILFQLGLTSDMLNEGTLVIPQYVNFSTLIYDLAYWFGFLLVGIIGLVMTIIGAIICHKSED